MKKEISAVCLLVLIFCFALINISAIKKLTGEIIEFVESAELDALGGNWEGAEQNAMAALEKWNQKGTYTQIVLRHEEIATATDAIYGMLKEIYSQNEGGVKGAKCAIVAQMENLSSYEQIKLGSIF